MASKRTYDVSEDGQPSPKRARPNGSSKARAHQSAYIDSTWGQKYVFSGRDDATTVPQDFDSDLECEGDAEAMAYLNSVREQAMGIPHLLVAPKIPIGPQLPTDLQQENDQAENEAPDEHIDRSAYNQGTGDFRGRYEDGAYIAQPDCESEHASHRRNPEHGEDWESSAMLDEEDAETLLRDAYYTSLRRRYDLLREKLQTPPPASAVAALPHTNSFHVGNFKAKSHVTAVWSRRLRETDPLPAQVASMDKDSIIRILRIMLSGRFLRRGYDLEERSSRWLWALLARLPDRGEMNHIDIGWIRDLGRRAVLLTQSLADMANLREALEGEGMDLGVHDAVDESSDDEEALQDLEAEEEDGVAQSDEAQSDEPLPEGEAHEALPVHHTSTEAEAQAEAPTERPEALPELETRPEAPTETQGPSAEPEVSATVDATVEAAVDAIVEAAVEDDQQSEPMDCSEDGEVAEDGEVLEDGEMADDKPTTEPETLEAAKLRILAELEQAATTEEKEARAAKVQLRARLNMRATLNMILTVAGEFYGQRDLLEFRDPFPGM
ncbi:V-SNARE [Plectosphaerella plurivora]|uniref:V-SNARE n=1 Tax=Plectosphaerella plurivora TaxID=936078 RepID=A0A9P9ACF2_9PEZI|nr:V-SNARE [Plectosphaerella plurivora]